MLKKESETVVKYNNEWAKRIINSNTKSHTKLTEIRKDLGTYVSMLEDKITQTKKDLVDDTHNLKELLFHKNWTFKLVKVLELDERIKDIKEQSQNEIALLKKRVELIDKPLQFPL